MINSVTYYDLFPTKLVLVFTHKLNKFYEYSSLKVYFRVVPEFYLISGVFSQTWIGLCDLTGGWNLTNGYAPVLA